MRLAGLGFAGLIGGLICAGQMLPVLEFTSRTMRSAPDGPHDIYPFSVEPYRMAEWIWPQVFGSHLAGNNTWGIFLPPQHKTFIWVPSLYMGILPIILAVSAMGFRGQGARRVWLSWIAVVSMVASIGEYAGPLWVARCIAPVAKIVGPHDPNETSAIRTDAKMRDGDGSVYGLMAVTLPGFSGFRYPAKLLTFTCLSVAGLAGIGFDRLLAGRSRRALRVAWILTIVSAFLFILVQWEQKQIISWFTSKAILKGPSAFGPFDVLATWKELRFSLFYGTIFLGLSVVGLISLKRLPQIATSFILLLVTADLVLANSPLVLTVPQSIFEDVPEVLTRIAESEAADPSPGPFRVHRMPYWDPVGFHFVSSPDRNREMVEWERKTLQPKYGIPLGISYTITEGVAELYDLSWFFAPFYVDLNVEGGLRENAKTPKLIYFPRRGFDLWATRYFVIPAVRGNDERRGSAAFSFDVELVWPKKDDRAEFRDEWEKHEDWRIYKNKRAFPRAWIVHQAEFGHPIEGDSRESRNDRNQLVGY